MKVMEKDGKINSLYSEEDHFSEILRIKKAYENGCSILIKGLENWNDPIRKRVDELGGNCDVHLVISPERNSSRLPFHKDERDVLVHLVYGEKNFTERGDDFSYEYLMKEGDCLLLQREYEHCAISQSECAHLSFGLRPDVSTSKDNKYLEIPNVEIIK